jgi:hypothetical protein
MNFKRLYNIFNNYGTVISLYNHKLCFSKEALEATLKKKRECNAKALQIVERLLENTVSEEWFLDCVSTLLCNVWHLYLNENNFIKLYIDLKVYIDIRFSHFHPFSNHFSMNITAKCYITA